MQKKLSKKILYIVIPFLQFQEKDLSIIKKISISLNTLVMFIVIIFATLYMSSQFLYPYNLKTDHMTIYGNKDISTDKKFLLAVNNAEMQVQTSILYNNKYNVKIHMVDSSLYYSFVATPFHMDTIAVNLFDYIHIKNFSIETHNEKYKYLSEEITHEIIHTLQAIKYGGWLRTFLIPHWVKEGYAEYIEEHKIVDNNPKEFLFKNKFRKNYTLYGLMVKHAIEKMHKSVDDLHLGKVDYDEVLDSLLLEYNITK